MIASLIGLGGVIVAGLSVWLSYKWRNAVMRDKLFEKQIEVISKMMDLISRLVLDATALFDLKDKEKVKEYRKGMQDRDESHLNMLQCTYFQAETFLPKEIMEKTYDLMIELTGVLSLYDIDANLPEENNCINQYWALINSIRNEYKIEKLTKEFQKLLPR